MIEPFPEPIEPVDPNAAPHDAAPRDAAPRDEPPLAPWILSLADEVTFPTSETVPHDLMWARIQRHRRNAVPADHTAVTIPGPQTPRVVSRRSWWYRASGIAAVLIVGIGVGRYVLPTAANNRGSQQMASHDANRADSIAALGLGPDALAALPYSNEPARVAMEEHLGRTVALLVTVRDENPTYGPGADVSSWARELLATTRMLIDEPQLNDVRTRRLLQDVELVLAQIVQARGSVPETQRAPSETMRETNLLPRVRAAATASRLGGEPILGGDD